MSSTEGLRVIVSGGRRFTDRRLLERTLDGYHIVALAHGAAPGADTLADLYARSRGIPVTPYPADWTGPCQNTCAPGHRKVRRDGVEYCPAAGVYRNQDMVDEFKGDRVVAFPGGNGTADLLRRAIAARLDFDVVELS